jgi:hypothetical protein
MISGKEAIMTEDKRARRKRADKLRKRIRELQAEAEAPAEDVPEMKPDESPLEYVERRMREISHKKNPPREEDSHND